MRGHFSLSRLVLRFSRYRLVLFVLPALVGVLVFGLGLLMPGEYTAMARLLPPRTNTATASALLNQIGGTETIGAAALTLKSPSELYASLFLSRSVQDRIIDRFRLDREVEIDRDGLRQALAEHTLVDVREDGIIELRYVDADPERAAAIVNGMIDAVYQKAQQLSRLEAENRLAFYDQIIGETRERLVSAEARLRDIETKTGYTRLKGQEEATSLTGVELHSTLLSKETQLARMRAVATDAHPSIRRIRAEIAALRAGRAAMERGDTRDQGVVIAVGNFPDIQARVEPMRREVQIQTEVLEYLMKAKQLSRVDEKRDLSNVQVLDAAVPPTRASGPRVMRNSVLASGIAFMLGVMACLVWDVMYRDRRRRRVLRRILSPYIGWRVGRRRSPRADAS